MAKSNIIPASPVVKIAYGTEYLEVLGLFVKIPARRRVGSAVTRTITLSLNPSNHLDNPVRYGEKREFQHETLKKTPKGRKSELS